MIKKGRRRFLVYFFSLLFLFSCRSAPDANRNEVSGSTDSKQHLSGGLAEEIRSLTETGILSSMLQALELIRSRNLSGSDFGRIMNGINTILIRLIYPDSPAPLPSPDLPQISVYSRIIREAENGVYLKPPEDSSDFFEHILPFLSLNSQSAQDVLSGMLRDLSKAALLRPGSVLPHYFTGMIHERAGRRQEAQAAYRQAYEISDECYPAMTGIARLRRLSGNLNEAAAILADLIIRYPDSIEIKRQLAITHYENRDFAKALAVADEILAVQPRNGDILLIKASILIEQGQFPPANAVLDSYSAINSNNKTYLFLRARVQAEGNRSRDSALNYLRSILRSSPDDEETLIYAAGLLMESSRPADLEEAREILERLRRISGSSINVLGLSLRDAVRRESWQEAQGFLNRILSARRTVQDLIDGYNIERGLGNNARALSFARELYERESSNNDYAVIYISALIDNGRREDASRLLESRLNSSSSGAVMSRYYFLRSRLQTNQDAALGDLRSSLFEDPRNLDAIIATFEIYHNRREERRAVYYLKQALAISPDHPRLRRYEREYASLLGRN